MKAYPLVVYLPDTKDVTISRFGEGNLKLGPGVFSYSRSAGALYGTCPGSTEECEAICFAKRIRGPIAEVYQRNYGSEVPPIPEECTVLRIHVSGDFDSVQYIENWIDRLSERPEVTCWAYTRSWRVPELLPALERLRTLANVQLFASMDPSCEELPPTGWRRAWIWRDAAGHWPMESRLKNWQRVPVRSDNQQAMDGTPSYVCPEETGRRTDCASCGYCFEGQKHDVTFIEH